MIEIGDFAHLSQVSTATLRHYDEIGLLEPVKVDGFTGYRYYSVSQLPRLNRILALKDLGLSLEQIERTLDDGLSAEQLRGMLRIKRTEVAQHLAEEQLRLRRIETRLRQIEQENSMPNYDVVLKTVPAMLVASRRVTIPTNEQVPDYLGPAYRETYEYVRRHGAKDIAPCLSVLHQGPEVLKNEVAEAIVPIDRHIQPSDRVQICELPRTQVAAVVHHGDFADFQQGHAALLSWIEANDYRISGPYREIYIQHNDDDLSDSTTEIQFPVEKG